MSICDQALKNTPFMLIRRTVANLHFQLRWYNQIPLSKPILILILLYNSIFTIHSLLTVLFYRDRSGERFVNQRNVCKALTCVSKSWLFGEWFAEGQCMNQTMTHNKPWLTLEEQTMKYLISVFWKTLFYTSSLIFFGRFSVLPFPSILFLLLILLRSLNFFQCCHFTVNSTSIPMIDIY